MPHGLLQRLGVPVRHGTASRSCEASTHGSFTRRPGSPIHAGLDGGAKAASCPDFNCRAEPPYGTGSRAPAQSAAAGVALRPPHLKSLRFQEHCARIPRGMNP